MVSTPEVFIDNSPISPGPYLTVKIQIARKALRQITEVLDVQKKLMSAR